MKFDVVFEPSEEGGFVVHVPSLRGCWSNGDTFEEAVKNIKEAIEAYLEPEELAKAKPMEIQVKIKTLL